MASEPPHTSGAVAARCGCGASRRPKSRRGCSLRSASVLRYRLACSRRRGVSARGLRECHPTMMISRATAACPLDKFDSRRPFPFERQGASRARAIFLAATHLQWLARPQDGRPGAGWSSNRSVVPCNTNNGIGCQALSGKRILGAARFSGAGLARAGRRRSTSSWGRDHECSC